MGKNKERQEPGKRRILATVNSRKDLINDPRHRDAAKFTLYSPKYSLACTFIPKNGCTNLRYSFAIANNLIQSEEDFEWIHSNNTAMTATNNELILAKLNFIVLRCPFARTGSYFLDKLLSINGKEGDKSYALAQSLFDVKDDTFTFEGFVENLWKNPNLINMDIHLKHQSDFLIMQDYDNWFDVTQFAEIKNLLKTQVNFTLFDTREMANHTTHKQKKISNIYLGNRALNELRRLKEEEKSVPATESMYNKTSLERIAILYMPDLLLYTQKIKNIPESRSKLIKHALEV